MIPPSLLSFFYARGLITWDKLILAWSSQEPIWKTDLQLALPPRLRPLWLSFTNRFTHSAFSQIGTKDALTWSIGNAIRPILVSSLYSALSPHVPLPSPSFPAKLWKAHCPLKSILFSWLLFSNKNLSWEVLQKKGWQGPSVCQFCSAAAESNYHMFFDCSASTAIWYELSLTYGFPH